MHTITESTVRIEKLRPTAIAVELCVISSKNAYLNDNEFVTLNDSMSMSSLETGLSLRRRHGGVVVVGLIDRNPFSNVFDIKIFSVCVLSHFTVIKMRFR